ncbi:MAG: hypothetical protein C0475_07925, partial [Planctomyces sp.]|nr:hypothetical protein [Planctomyces sp.]
MVGAWAAPAWAQSPLDDADVILSVQGGAITTGRVVLSPLGEQAVAPERVFFAPLNEFGSTANPGFDSFAGTFAAGSRVGFDILQALRVWDGQDFDRVAAAPADPALRVNFGPLIRFAPQTDQVVAGILLTASGGLFHNHYSFTALSQAQPPAEVPDPGIYLLAMRMVSTDPAAGPSEPFYFVLSHASPESEAQEAIDWVRVNLLAPPGPAGCTVADV